MQTAQHSPSYSPLPWIVLWLPAPRASPALCLVMVAGAFLGNTRLSVSALVALAPLSSSLQTFLCFPVSWGCPALPRSSEGFQGLKHSQPTNEDLFPWTG